MGNKTVYMYVLNTMADWEPGFAIAELRKGRWFRPGIPPFEIKTFSLAKEPVVTMGGIRIMPDLAVGEINSADAALLLLPGSGIWNEPGHEPVMEKAKAFVAAGVPVAGICDATLALARAGLLDNRAHTSNYLAGMKSLCPNYKGEAFYRDEPAVTGDKVITASGLAPLEFACQIFKCLDVLAPATLDAWYKLYVTKEPRYYFELMNAAKPPLA